MTKRRTFHVGTADFSAHMYYTGIDSFTKQEACMVKDLRDRKMRRGRIQVFKSENYFLVREALLKAGAPT